MWIQRHDGSLLNIESFDKIAVSELDQTYKVCAWRSGSFSVLATYKKKQQAEEAKIAIFCGIRKGDRAITMPCFF